MEILWLKTELLHPVDKGGKIRTYEMLKRIKDQAYVCYLTLDDGSAAADAQAKATEYCHELIAIPHRHLAKFTPRFYLDVGVSVFSSTPYALQKYASTAMQEAVVRQSRRTPFDLIVCDFLTPSINMPRTLPCKAVLFQHNVEAMIWKRHYEVQRNPLKRAYLRSQWIKMQKYEKTACQRFDYIIGVSKEDCGIIREDYGVDKVADVPTGVDTEFFKPDLTSDGHPNSLVFTGSMDWLPNEDAIHYFVSEILPRVRQNVPNVTLAIVGRNPSERLVELARRDPSIVVTGRVDDVRPYVQNAAAYIVPIRIGGGTRIKIYEAMAMERPVVSTPVGAEGLPVRDGVDILLAGSADGFADAVVKLLTNRAFARELGRRAGTTVRQGFGWDAAADRFLAICKLAGEL